MVWVARLPTNNLHVPDNWLWDTWTWDFFDGFAVNMILFRRGCACVSRCGAKESKWKWTTATKTIGRTREIVELAKRRELVNGNTCSTVVFFFVGERFFSFEPFGTAASPGRDDDLFSIREKKGGKEERWQLTCLSAIWKRDRIRSR